MKINPLYTIILSLLIVLGSCINNNDQCKNGFAIYLLADSTLTYKDISETSIEDLILETNPIITDKDIEYYRIIYFNGSSIPHHSFKLRNKDQPFNEGITPFVVVACGKRVYVGEYWPIFLCIMQKSILIIRIAHDENTEYHVLPYFQNEIDKRNDELILKALEKAGVLQVSYEDDS